MPADDTVVQVLEEIRTMISAGEFREATEKLATAAPSLVGAGNQEAFLQVFNSWEDAASASGLLGFAEPGRVVEVYHWAIQGALRMDRLDDAKRLVKRMKYAVKSGFGLPEYPALGPGNAVPSRESQGLLEIDRGDLAYRKGDPDEAMEYYEEAVKALHRMPPGEPLIAAYCSLGQMALELGEADRAGGLLSRATWAVTQLGDDPAAAPVKRLEARIREAEGDPSGARETYREAMERFRDKGDLYLSIACQLDVARILFQSGNLEEAVEHFQEALGNASRLGLRQLAARAEEGLGASYHKLGLGHKALGPLRRTALYARAAEDNAARARAHRTLGDIFISEGLKTRALLHYNAAVKLLRKGKDRSGTLQLVPVLVTLLLEKGDLKGAGKLIRKVKPAAGNYLETDQFREIYRDLSRKILQEVSLSDALRWFDRHLIFLEKYGRGGEAARGLEMFGDALKEKGLHQQAAGFYRKSLTIFVRLGDAASAAAVARKIGHSSPPPRASQTDSWLIPSKSRVAIRTR
ncbi:MAG: tetratricopeptide repeat protein [Actinobacteria bacterium]|nr:tetratricopeptide repeat protein [Actinomycetota bacterium]